jgi:RNA polymerase sigma-70 factor, ECF subfamily
VNSFARSRVILFPVVAGNTDIAPTRPNVSPATFPSDERAMMRLQNHDSDALHFLFDRYSKLVFSIAMRVLRDLGEAEEIVQEVFMYLFQRASLYHPEKGSAKSWILQLAHHRSLDRRSYLARRNFYAGTNLESWNDNLAGEVDVEREVGFKLDGEQLRHAFEALTEYQRQTLQLFFFEELQFSEIAERLNEPLGNIRHYYYRGLERLRKCAFITSVRNEKPWKR